MSISLKSVLATGLMTLPAAAQAVLIDLAYTGTVTGYDNLDDDGSNVPTVLPLGATFTVSARFDTDLFGASPATGSADIAGLMYSVISASRNGGGNFGGNIYGFLDLILNGPTIASIDPNYLPGTLFISLGVPYPNPIGTQISAYPLSAIGVGYDLVSGNGFRFEYANVSGRGAITAANVPEVATWLMMIGGFGMIGAGMRRRRVRVSFG